MSDTAPPTRTRRSFCAAGACCGALALAPGWTSLLAQAAARLPADPMRPDVAAIDRDRILAEAGERLAHPPAALGSAKSSRSPGGPNEYFSETEADTEPPAGTSPAALPFVAHRDLLYELGRTVCALAAAQLLTSDGRYSDAAARHLRAWFLDPATRMRPRLDFGAVAFAGYKPQATPAAQGTFAGILETLPLVQVAQAIPFLAASGSLTDADLAGVGAWFKSYLQWLTSEELSGPRLAQLARDHKDHHATSWMLQVTAYTLFTLPEGGGGPKNEDHSMTELRRRFRAVILRTQINADGEFPAELSTPDPYRNSLFNLDMIACLCTLLSTRFESAWEYQLEDGPGMRVAMAYHFRFMADRAKWPFRADSSYFTALPGRRVSLLLGARAYSRPEYAELWRKLSPVTLPVPVARTVPVSQPILWVTRVPRRAGQ